MADDNREKWYRSPITNINKRALTKRMRKVEDATVRHAHKFIIKRWSNVIEVQKRIILWVITVALLILATGFQLMWYQQSYRTSADANNGTYAEAVLGPINTLNPLYASSSAEQSASYLMFSSLLRYDKTGHLNNDLVKNISVDKTHTQYTINVRSDVKWHDGEKLTASDIAFTVGVMQNPNTRTSYAGWSDVSVKVINDTTLVFKLSSPYAAFEHALTFPVIPEHMLKDIAPGKIRENTFSQNPIGSGPFALRLVQDVDTKSSRKVIYMVRNDEYYAGKADLARFQLHVFESNDAIVNALSQNEVNAAADILPTDINRVDNNRYVVVSKPIQSGVYAIINVKSQFMRDANIRTALRLATDTKAIREKLPENTPDLYLPFTNDQLSGAALTEPKFDLSKAKKTLDSIGWKIGANGIRQKSGKDLKISVVTLKDGEFERVLGTLSGQWRSLGIEVETKVVDPNDVSQNVAQSVLQPRNYDVLLYRLNIGADPDVYAYWHSSQTGSDGSNFSNYSNIISDDALSSARSRTEPELRNAKYLTFARQWLNDIPAIGLYQSTMQYVYNKKINSLDEGINLISPVDRYSDVMEWSVGKRNVYKTP
ncbi:MAG: ABC transporter substrate-binding protein [Candidatus Saccharimonadales bacterium]